MYDFHNLKEKQSMERTFNLEETRKNIVAKGNEMIQQSRFALSAIENKAVLYLISKISPNDKPGKHYFCNCQEFKALIKWNGAGSYQDIKAMLTSLASKQWWIELGDEDHNESLVRWFNIVRMSKGTGNIEISFHEDMFPFLLDLQSRKEMNGLYYTAYRLQNVALMKSRYSPRLYELLKSYQPNNRVWVFENGTNTNYDLQRRLAEPDVKGNPIIPKSWSNWSIFKRDVLEPAKEEINKYTDMKIEYCGKKQDIHHKKTRAIRTIEFYMASKTAPEQRETEDIIDAEYSEEVVKEESYHQLSIEELFFQEHEKKVDEEKEENWQNELSHSKHPLIREEFPEYNENQICTLFNLAVKNRCPGHIDFSCWDLFVVDLLDHYQTVINGSPEDTKKSKYKRLCDMVKNDYDNIVHKLYDKYEKADR